MHFLKRSCFFLLSAILLLEGMSFLIVETGFQWNQKYIAEKLCVNRFNDSMHCNGSCYLKDQLQQTASNQSSNQKSAPLIAFLLLYIESQAQQKIWLPEQAVSFSSCIAPSLPGFSTGPDHPPTA